MPDLNDNNPPLAAEPDPHGDVDVSDCFEPWSPPATTHPSSRPKTTPKPPTTLTSLFSEYLQKEGYSPDAAMARSAVEHRSTHPSDVWDGVLPTTSADNVHTRPEGTSPAPTPPPQPKATAAQIFAWLKRSVLAQTGLPDHAAELATYWIISTWFHDALHVLPCLVITGPMHEALGLLRCLSHYCWKPALVAGFRRDHLGVLNWACQTYLVSEPHLDKRGAALLGNLTDRSVLVVGSGGLARYAKPTAIYVGEAPGAHKIQHSIHIHIAATLAEKPSSPVWLRKHIEYLPVHLAQYRDAHLDEARRCLLDVRGLPSETAAIATALGSCIVNEPQLVQSLILLLRARNNQGRSMMTDFTEAVVAEAALALTSQERQHIYVSEIAAEANRLLELRGERVTLNPEKVGHSLRKLGLRTRRLTQRGNGLLLDSSTVTLIKQVAAVYVEEDLLASGEGLPCQQITENKTPMKVM